MHFLLFLVSFALNPVVMFMVPDGLAVQFLSAYAGGSIVFSLFFTIFFSKAELLRFAKPALVALTFSLLGLSLVTDIGLWLLYPYSLLFGDYVCTQSKSIKVALAFRLVLIVSALPIVLFPDVFIEMIGLRAGICIAFSSAVLIYAREITPLSIKSTFKWIAITYVFYSGTLLAIPMLAMGSGDHVKMWFIGTQVGLGLILKQLDFSVRAVQGKSALLFRLADIGVLVVIPAALTVFYFDWVILLLYLISFIALKQLKPANPQEA